MAYQDTKLSSAIEDYSKWNASFAGEKMDVNHELIRTGLNKIASVLTLMSVNLTKQHDNAVNADIDRIHALADSVTYNWKSGKHTDMIKLAFSKIANVVAALQLKKTPAFTREINALNLKIKDIDLKTRPSTNAIR